MNKIPKETAIQILTRTDTAVLRQLAHRRTLSDKAEFLADRYQNCKKRATIK